ncbi:hypothetical protein [Colwellia sp. UCD-KL20]|uniref:hypothetical protein n=1 Tax=Colwellia sp. UCD-KL20 TaxID=1917165 RepID=UPI0015C3520C|nr:hypothetical protein [Colwellia sp. UCD-KL20]
MNSPNTKAPIKNIANTATEAITNLWITTEMGSSEPLIKLLTIAIDIVTINKAPPILRA